MKFQGWTVPIIFRKSWWSRPSRSVRSLLLSCTRRSLNRRVLMRWVAQPLIDFFPSALQSFTTNQMPPLLFCERQFAHWFQQKARSVKSGWGRSASSALCLWMKEMKTTSARGFILSEAVKHSNISPAASHVWFLRARLSSARPTADTHNDLCAAEFSLPLNQ